VGEAVIDRFGSSYENLQAQREHILAVLEDEERRFARTLERGLREVDKLVERSQPVDGRALFGLFETHGLPPEVSVEELSRNGVTVERWQDDFELAQSEHQQRSRDGSAQRFAGGLADRSERTVRLHTATHLLGGALRAVLGEHVHQRGSNITEERLRFDFSHDGRLTDAQLGEVERIVNQAITDDVEVRRLELPRAEAEALGAEQEFGHRYPEVVSVYVIDDLSAEFCGGPHVPRTGQVGRFRILTQEASGAGVRRIRATVED
jgi:alanyl-tRNA synthetase